MSRVRNVQLIANVEPVVGDLAWNVARDKGFSMSTYLRWLIIQDLKASGRLTPDMMDSLL